MWRGFDVGPTEPGLGRFFERAPVLVATATADGYLQELGGAWTATLGWSDEELTARPFIEFVHPDDREATLSELEALNTGERVVGFENRYQRHDDGWVWLRWHARSDDDGIYAVAWDVTAEVTDRELVATRTELLEAITGFQQQAITANVHELSIEQIATAVQRIAEADEVLIATILDDGVAPVLRPLAGSPAFLQLARDIADGTTASEPTGLVALGEIADLNTMVGAVVRTGEPVRSADVAHDPRRSPQPTGDIAAPNFVGLPLLGNGQLLGVLAVAGVPDVDDHRLKDLLEPVAVTVGSVIDQLTARRIATSTTQMMGRLSNLFSAVIQDLDGIVIVSDPDGTIRFMNSAAEQLLGVSSDEVAGNLTPSMFVAETGRGGRDGYMTWLLDPGHEPEEWAFLGAGGDTVPVLVRPSVLRDHDGSFDGWVQLGTELTVRYQVLAEQTRSAVLANEIDSLRQRERELGLLAEGIKYVMSSSTTADAVQVIRSFAPRILSDANPSVSALEQVGDDDGDPIGRADCWAIRTGATHVSRPGRSIRCRHLPERGSFACVPLTDGEHQVATLTVELPPELDPDDTRSRAVQHRAEDVARQMGIALSYLKLRRSLEYQASADALTGIGNRRVAEAAIETALAAQRSAEEEFAILMFDLDGFKAINDDGGHDVGDRVLRDVAGILSDTIREGDTAARLGGDEFLVVLRRITDIDTPRIAELLRHTIQEQVIVQPGVPCTASVGALHVRVGDVSASQLMARVDSALYQAKHAGRNCVFVASSEPAHHPMEAPA
jgi:diguanylate cyclase (GGDEF)-like protein/PAS domain S-box-containing protein